MAECCNCMGYHEQPLDWFMEEMHRVINEWAEVKKENEDFTKDIDGKIVILEKDFADLKTYVDNYFANLDMQDEVNKKLDQMYQDGTLGQILSNYMNLININVKQPPFGLASLLGDGSDESAKLTAIINYAKTNNIKARLYFPRGVYLFNNVNIDTPHLWFEGEEKGGTEFRTTSHMFTVSENFTTFTNIAFWVRSQLPDTSFIDASARKLLIYNCMMYDAKNAIKLFNSPGTVLNELTISMDSNSYDGAVGLEFNGLNNSTRVTNCVVNMRGNTNAKCVYVHGKPQDISFELLETAGGIYGIEVDSDAENVYQNFKITNAIIDEPEQRGIYIHTASVPAIIKGAFIYPVNTAAIGVRIEGGKNILLDSAQIINNHSLAALTGISCNVVNSVQITNCQMIDCTTPINTFGANSDSFSIIGNIMRNDNVECANAITIQQVFNSSVIANIFNGKITTPINIPATAHNSVVALNNARTVTGGENNILDTTVINQYNMVSTI